MRASLLTTPDTLRALYPFAPQADSSIEPLRNSARNEVLAFLEERPIHTVYLAGLIRDNGLESELNRGTFYGCRNYFGQLEGVALIGHAILMETASDRALQAFAIKAQQCTTAHILMCEESRIDQFWGYYAQAGQEMRRACREILYELRWPIEVSKQMPKLRLATTSDLDALRWLLKRAALILATRTSMVFLIVTPDVLRRDEPGS
jgi:hypothetical protein